MTSFDDDLEKEVQKLLNPGEEGRRARAVEKLHQSSPAGLVLRIGGVAIGVAAAVALYYMLGASLALDALNDLCRAVGLCG